MGGGFRMCVFNFGNCTTWLDSAQKELSMRNLFFVLIVIFSFLAISKISFADDATMDSLNAKLDQILENQEKISSELQELRNEIQIVKVRTVQ